MGVKDTQGYGLPSADPGKNLVSAIVEFRDGLTDKGSLCQCCGRFGKVYCRKINRTMCKGLIWLINEESRTGDRYHAVPAELRQLPTLKHWGLVERLDNSDEKKRGGLWAATPFGERFACNASCGCPKGLTSTTGGPSGCTVGRFSFLRSSGSSITRN